MRYKKALNVKPLDIIEVETKYVARHDEISVSLIGIVVQNRRKLGIQYSRIRTLVIRLQTDLIKTYTLDIEQQALIKVLVD